MILIKTLDLWFITTICNPLTLLFCHLTAKVLTGHFTLTDLSQYVLIIDDKNNLFHLVVSYDTERSSV